MAQNRQNYMVNDELKDKAWEIIHEKDMERKIKFKNIQKRVRAAHDAVVKGSPYVEPEIDNA